MAATAPVPPRERLIAEGASARIYASQDSHGRPAALKLSRSAACDPVLLVEAAAAARFKHPALLPVLEQGSDAEGRVWLLLPLLSGRTLADWSPALPELLDGLGPIADALDYLHHLGFGHADLKPSNVLVAQDGQESTLLLADLGLLSELGKPALGGTPAYLSPGRLDGKPLSWRDDLHALAVLFYERIAGHLPWLATRGDALLQDIRVGRVRSLRTSRADLPGTLDTYIVATLQARDAARCVMDWLDRLRAELGLRPLPRRLYLRPANGEVEDISTRERLAMWLRANLYSSTSPAASAGREELRSLEQIARGDSGRLRSVLEHLLSAQLLQDHAGQAIFADDPSMILNRLRKDWLLDTAEPEQPQLQWGLLLSSLPMAFSIEELRSTADSERAGLEEALQDLCKRGRLANVDGGRFEPQGESDLNAVADCSIPLPRAVFASQWLAAESRPGARLQLLALAQATNAEELIDSIPQAAVLDIVERAPAEVCDTIRSFLCGRSTGVAGARLSGLLDIVRLVRTDRLAEAIERFWGTDDILEVATSATLNRFLVYQLSDAGRVQDARAFLTRWRERRDEEIRGTPIEIQIAARELNVLGTYGAHAEARELAASYQLRFAGRDGAWILNIALASLAEDRGDRAEALRQSEAALGQMQSGQDTAQLEFDLLVYMATTIISASDRSRWPLLDGAFKRATELSVSLDIPTITHRLEAAHALRALNRGDLADARTQVERLRLSAERTGELKRALYIETYLIMIARESGDYVELRRCCSRLGHLIEGQESVREHLSFRQEVSLLELAVGDLEAAGRTTELGLEATLGSEHHLFQGFFLGISGRLRYLAGGAVQAAAAAFRAAIDAFSKAHALRYRNEYQLELIAVDPTADPDGSLLAAVIDHEEAVGERRLLPRAWQLEARRLRSAGAIREAAVALEEAFRVAGTLVSPEHRWPLHVEAAELALAAGERAAARSDLERAVAILHDLSLQFPDPAVRERFLARPDRRAVLERLRTLDT
ncbi:hypothetical protein FJ251_01820 [bacterium]|nr:hypothetical protein [bacterium]